MKEWQILLSGSGGQGLGLAGKILAEAALLGGLKAAHSQSYGARARGGYSESGVVLGSRKIAFPLIEKPNLLLALTAEAYHKNAPHLAEGGQVIFDSDTLPVSPGQRFYGFPLARTARELGNEKGVAILSLGVITALFGFIQPGEAEKAITDNLPPALLEPNIRCYRQGLKLAG